MGFRYVNSRPRYRRTNSEYGKLPCVTLMTCTVAVEDLANVIHSVNVTAETLYEAVAQALATLRGEPWVAEIGKGLTTSLR